MPPPTLLAVAQAGCMRGTGGYVVCGGSAAAVVRGRQCVVWKKGGGAKVCSAQRIRHDWLTISR